MHVEYFDRLMPVFVYLSSSGQTPGVNTNPSIPPYGQRWMLKDQSLNKGYKAHASVYREETGLSSGARGY